MNRIKLKDYYLSPKRAIDLTPQHFRLWNNLVSNLTKHSDTCQ